MMSMTAGGDVVTPAASKGNLDQMIADHLNRLGAEGLTQHVKGRIFGQPVEQIRKRSPGAISPLIFSSSSSSPTYSAGDCIGLRVMFGFVPTQMTSLHKGGNN
ncbi:hypothetical protein ACFQDZ_26885 [Sulfitobacter pacificus]|uniref:hypothetical protein n=1 Tax=Sulfitobacter pacificus TaxID=1499314 RepID=UPI00360A9037